MVQPEKHADGCGRKAFETIALAKVAKSAQEAREIKYLKDTDGITMNRDRLLFDAKEKALELAENYQVPDKPRKIRLPGPSGNWRWIWLSLTCVNPARPRLMMWWFPARWPRFFPVATRRTGRSL